jgi:hypothetical protein
MKFFLATFQLETVRRDDGTTHERVTRLIIVDDDQDQGDARDKLYATYPEDYYSYHDITELVITEAIQ